LTTLPGPPYRGKPPGRGRLPPRRLAWSLQLAGDRSGAAPWYERRSPPDARKPFPPGDPNCLFGTAGERKAERTCTVPRMRRAWSCFWPRLPATGCTARRSRPARCRTPWECSSRASRRRR
jgi:hypothetical protein